MHSLVLSSFFAAFLFTCVVDGSMSALPAPNLRSSYKKKKKKKIPACTPLHRRLTVGHQSIAKGVTSLGRSVII